VPEKNKVNKLKSNNQASDIEWESVTSFSGLPGDESGVIEYVAYEKNPPIIFSPKSTVRRLEVGIVSVQSKDEELLHHLLQRTR
jgi:hypothetical protein